MTIFPKRQGDSNKTTIVSGPGGLNHSLWLLVVDLIYMTLIALSPGYRVRYGPAKPYNARREEGEHLPCCRAEQYLNTITNKSWEGAGYNSVFRQDPYYIINPSAPLIS